MGSTLQVVHSCMVTFPVARRAVPSGFIAPAHCSAFSSQQKQQRLEQIGFQVGARIGFVDKSK